MSKRDSSEAEIEDIENEDSNSNLTLLSSLLSLKRHSLLCHHLCLLLQMEQKKGRKIITFGIISQKLITNFSIKKKFYSKINFMLRMTKMW